MPLRPLRLGAHTLDLDARAHIMGILNVTPDSFSDGGRYNTVDSALAHARAMVAAGADIIDVGGESTRPGAPVVSAQEEIARVAPVIEAICRELDVPVSIDTTKAEVASAAILAGARMINDISGLERDPALAALAAHHGCAIVLMHMRGTPQTMQQHTEYEDLVGEVVGFLRLRVARAEAMGVEPDQIVIDPGLGFSKTGAQNLTLLRHTDALVALGYPVLIGASRKSFLGPLTGGKAAADRLLGTAAANSAALLAGAHIVRVHDVEAARDVARVCDAIRRA
jgi:dihydropteroate synthase